MVRWCSKRDRTRWLRVSRLKCSARLIHSRLRSFRQASEQEELVIGPHADHVRHAIGQREKGGDAADVPDVLVAEAMRMQRVEVCVDELRAVQRDLDCEIEHRALTWRDIGLAVI